MKRQILSLLAGATLIVTPLIANTQPASAYGFGGGGLPGHMMKDLNITEQQKTQLQAIREKTRSRIEAVLTDAQKQQLAATKQQKMAELKQRRESGQKRGEGKGKRGGMKGVFESLNLSEQQKSQIKTIMQESRKEMSSVLTAEQKAKIRQKMTERMQEFL
jgi:periplasmic protein CpxP/Spy